MSHLVNNDFLKGNCSTLLVCFTASFFEAGEKCYAENRINIGLTKREIIANKHTYVG